MHFKNVVLLNTFKLLGGAILYTGLLSIHRPHKQNVLHHQSTMHVVANWALSYTAVAPATVLLFKSKITDTKNILFILVLS